jgi:hypothetical protein
MTVKELRDKLEGVPDDTPIVVRGHFGESITVEAFCWGLRKGPNRLVEHGWQRDGKEIGAVFVIPHVDIGPEPD